LTATSGSTCTRRSGRSACPSYSPVLFWRLYKLTVSARPQDMLPVVATGADPKAKLRQRDVEALPVFVRGGGVPRGDEGRGAQPPAARVRTPIPRGVHRPMVQSQLNVPAVPSGGRPRDGYGGDAKGRAGGGAGACGGATLNAIIGRSWRGRAHAISRSDLLFFSLVSVVRKGKSRVRALDGPCHAQYIIPLIQHVTCRLRFCVSISLLRHF
jgi:hypothetical protein